MTDYVVPMVFDDDASWLDDFHRATGRTLVTSRWRSWGTERIHVESVTKNMPFVRTIYIILAKESQIRPWMKYYDKVRIVFHRDFIPQEYLPTFSSRTIEMFLHRIPDLAEQFIYGNDDMFPLSPLNEEDFFVDGHPCQRHKEIKLPPLLTQFEYMCKQELNMIASAFGKQYVSTCLFGGHSLSPIKKSTCEKVWSQFGDKISASITPNGREDINFNQYIYSFWQHLSGEYVEKVPKRTFTSIQMPIETLSALFEGDTGILCINDDEIEGSYSDYASAIVRLLEKKLK